jgi:hypothetical protein
MVATAANRWHRHTGRPGGQAHQRTRTPPGEDPEVNFPFDLLHTSAASWLDSGDDLPSSEEETG